jgi:hypothetical protein
VVPAEPKTFLLDEGAGVFSWHNVMVTEVRGLMDLKHVRALDQLSGSLIKSFPGGVHSITRLKMGTPVSDREVRQSAARVLNARGEALHSYCLLEGIGVWAAARRAVLRGMNVLSKHPLAIYDALPPLVAAVAPKVRTDQGGTIDGAALTRALEITHLIAATFRVE